MGLKPMIQGSLGSSSSKPKPLASTASSTCAGHKQPPQAPRDCAATGQLAHATLPLATLPLCLTLPSKPAAYSTHALHKHA